MLKYDFIILGSGAAGLSLLMRMIVSGHFTQKRILLIDKEAKNKNDRTWCYWEKDKGFFEAIVFKRWESLFFHSDSFSQELDIWPYQYKMIRGIDFYTYCFDIINRQKNIDIRYGEINAVACNKNGTSIYLDGEELVCAPATVFNSLNNPSNIVQGNLNLLQHFKGWFIESATDQFNMDQAILMDFRVHQRYGTSFIYVLPVTNKKALVEYTLFTPQTLNAQQYKTELENYINHFLKITNYSITEEEFGIIPMSNARFKFYENGMYNIGIAGGQTKASTGYTFQFIQKQSWKIVNCLIQNKPFSSVPVSSKRFQFYDNVLLQLLISQQLSGKEIFTRLFQKNRAQRIFKFLDNESSLGEELLLISKLQTIPFLKAALKQF